MAAIDAEQPPPDLVLEVRDEMVRLISANAQVLAMRCTEACIQQVWSACVARSVASTACCDFRQRTPTTEAPATPLHMSTPATPAYKVVAAPMSLPPRPTSPPPMMSPPSAATAASTAVAQGFPRAATSVSPLPRSIAPFVATAAVACKDEVATPTPKRRIGEAQRRYSMPGSEYSTPAYSLCQTTAEGLDGYELSSLGSESNSRPCASSCPSGKGTRCSDPGSAPPVSRFSLRASPGELIDRSPLYTHVEGVSPELSTENTAPASRRDSPGQTDDDEIEFVSSTWSVNPSRQAPGSADDLEPTSLATYLDEAKGDDEALGLEGSTATTSSCTDPLSLVPCQGTAARQMFRYSVDSHRKFDSNDPLASAKHALTAAAGFDANESDDAASDNSQVSRRLSEHSMASPPASFYPSVRSTASDRRDSWALLSSAPEEAPSKTQRPEPGEIDRDEEPFQSPSFPLSQQLCKERRSGDEFDDEVRDLEETFTTILDHLAVLGVKASCELSANLPLADVAVAANSASHTFEEERDALMSWLERVARAANDLKADCECIPA